MALFASDTVDMTAGLGRNVATDPEGAAREAVAAATSKSSFEPALCICLPTVAEVETGMVNLKGKGTRETFSLVSRR